MKLIKYIKYISLIAAFAITLSTFVGVNAQVLTGKKSVITTASSVKSILTPNCDYSAKNVSGTYPINTVGYITGPSVTYKCSDGITVEFLDVSFSNSRGYINSKALKITAIPTPNAFSISSGQSLAELIVLKKPSCIPKESNIQGNVSKGQIGTVINDNVIFVCEDKSLFPLAYVRFVAGTGANRDTVEGYVPKKDLKITKFDTTAKRNIVVATPTKNVDVLSKPTCTTSRRYNDNIIANASAYASGSVVGTTYKVVCGKVTETYYNVSFPRDPNVAEAEYIEGYINSKNLKLTPITNDVVNNTTKSFIDYQGNLYLKPTCTFVPRSLNDDRENKGTKLINVTGKVVGELKLTCGTVVNTFYKVNYSYLTGFEYHELATSYILSTDL